MLRQIVLDTETTGLRTEDGHRIIEVGCLEVINRRVTGNNLHYYLNPKRAMEQEAIDVHGITSEFLADKPVFSDIVAELVAYLDGAELVIHNAPFDVGFLNAELVRAGKKYRQIGDFCTVLDTLVMARHIHPGQRNSLDALCKRYTIDNSNRDLHGALLDAELLAQVYLAMTGGQAQLFQSAEDESASSSDDHSIRRLSTDRSPLNIIVANAQELTAHADFLKMLQSSET